MIVGVIDLGTNTCNLVIAQISETKINFLYRDNKPVKLGGNNLICNDAFDRVVAVLSDYVEICKSQKTIKIDAYATSAVRSACNRTLFVDIVRKQTGLNLMVISGKEELDFIVQGAMLGSKIIDQKFRLLVDIGGGSIELALLKGTSILLGGSYNIGMARILEFAKQPYPVSSAYKTMLIQYFKQELNSFLLSVKSEILSADISMIGCAGAYETFLDIKYNSKPGTVFYEFDSLKEHEFRDLINKLQHFKQYEIEAMSTVIEVRKKMIVPASIFIEFLVDELNIEKIDITGYALAEGVISTQKKGFND